MAVQWKPSLKAHRDGICSVHMIFGHIGASLHDDLDASVQMDAFGVAICNRMSTLSSDELLH